MIEDESKAHIIIPIVLFQIIQDMSDNSSTQLWSVAKFAGLAAVSVGINHLVKHLLGKKDQKHKTKRGPSIKTLPSMARLEAFEAIKENQQFSNQQWGSLKLIDIEEEDGLLQELEMMTKIVCPFQKVNNLIVDLQIHHAKTYPCPLVAHQIKRRQDEPFLTPESLVKPGEFVIQNCCFRAGQSIETEKKFMRAGPRSTQYFDSATVRADIVCSGKAAPGINNLIRELVVLLKDIYKVEKVTGIRFSWRGYYNNDMLDLTPELVQTIHHRGGSFLGLSSSPCDVNAVIESMLKRGINQLYLIGGNDTIKNAIEIYRQIKERRLNIAICVVLKAINKDIAYFDNCFGFQSAVEQTQRFIEEGYALGKSNFNSVVLVKVPGRFSGFLAMDAVRAARNVNICLVPEFQVELYGERGLLQYIKNRVQAKGYCIIVYSEGASYSFCDIPRDKHHQLLLEKQTKMEYAFDLFLKQEIDKILNESGLNPHNLFFFDAQDAVRTVPANAFDTKICSQIALCSIEGLMCGYTNFVIGHFKNRVAMVPMDQMGHGDRFCLKVEDENWQTLLATTGQPSFKSSEPENIKDQMVEL